ATTKSGKQKAGNLIDEYNLGYNGEKFLGNDGLVLYLPFDGDMKDKSGNNINATNVGADLVNGKLGGAYDFNGLSFGGDYAILPDDSRLDFTGELTVSSWIYAKAAPGQYGINCVNNPVGGTLERTTILSKYDYNAGAERGWNLGPDWCGNYLSFHINNNSRIQINDPNFFVNKLNRWVLVTGVYKPSSYMRLYEDGVLVVQIVNPSVPNAIVYSSSSDPVRIGVRAINGQSHFNGTLDEVRIYNRSLSSEEVYYLYKYG
ncbi:MAG: LamG domain-containing protein, partial [Nanoarchaeota archaeon]